MGLVAIVFAASCGRGGRRGHSSDNDSIRQEEENVALASDKNVTYPDLDFKLYMERSGSMTPFDNAASKGEFKRTVSDMLNHIPVSNNDTLIYIVNDDIYPFPKGIRDFISERNFFDTTKEIGDASHTDFKKIFGLILDNLNRNEVAILISDLIYSVDNDENVNAQKIINEASAMANASFRKHPGVEVMVLKFLADYHGPYYPYNSPMQGKEYVGDRPFYAMIIGSLSSMEALMKDSRYAEFRNFSNIKGYQDMFTFTNKTYKPDYTVINSSYGKKGSYKTDRDRDNKDKVPEGQIHSIKDTELPREGNLIIPVAVDLSGIPMTAAYKTDKKNYEVVSESGFKIEDINPINAEKSDGKLGNATHIFTLSLAGAPKNETISLRMKNNMPRWINLSSTEDDTDMGANDFSHTTFGFGPMMEGVRSALTPAGESTPYLFNLGINIKK